ncbi:MAG TPA: hypothetical protein ENH94_10445 [Phycisphaerales bacterium]|nr:hypothetical protein [Phycisphaerales bacterium]
MTNEEYDLDEVCDLLVFGVNCGAVMLDDLQQWFERLSEYHSRQLTQTGNHVVRAAISVLDQMIYEKACLVCQYCPSQVFDLQMPIEDRVPDLKIHEQMERRLLNQLSVLAM